MITFKKIKIRNFMSIGNTPVTIDLNTHNTTLVVGENGCGKSQCYTDAITYVLFNKSFRGINKPNLVNSINESECLVEIDFSSGNNEYRIRRGMKPSVFEIYKNGELIDQDAKSKDYQIMLEKQILGMNFRSFTQIVILGSASFTPFMQLSAQARREVIEEILEIQVFSTMHSVLKTRIAEIKESQKDAEYRLEIIKEKINLNREHTDKMIADLKSRNESCGEKIKLCNQEIESLSAQIDEYNKQIDSLKKKITDRSSVQQKIKKYQTYKDKIVNNLNRASKEIEFFENNADCPTCKQTIGNEFKQSAIFKRKEKKSEFDEGIRQLESEMQSIESRLAEIDEIESKIQEIQSSISSCHHKSASESNYIKKLQHDISENIDKINSLLKDQSASGESNPSLEEQKRETESRLDDIRSQRYYADVSYKMLKDTGIKTKIIRQYLPVINKLINKYLTRLDFYVQFVLDEEFKESIKSRYRDDFSYESFSEGEKARINVSLLLTWREIARRKNSAACNLLILDEVFSSALDLDGTGKLMQLLNESTDDDTSKNNIVVISHTIPDISSDRDRFDRVMKVTKQNNFSRYTDVSDEIEKEIGV